MLLTVLVPYKGDHVPVADIQLTGDACYELNYGRHYRIMVRDNDIEIFKIRHY